MLTPGRTRQWKYRLTMATISVALIATTVRDGTHFENPLSLDVTSSSRRHFRLRVNETAAGEHRGLLLQIGIFNLCGPSGTFHIRPDDPTRASFSVVTGERSSPDSGACDAIPQPIGPGRDTGADDDAGHAQPPTHGGSVFLQNTMELGTCGKRTCEVGFLLEADVPPDARFTVTLTPGGVVPLDDSLLCSGSSDGTFSREAEFLLIDDGAL